MVSTAEVAELQRRVTPPVPTSLMLLPAQIVVSAPASATGSWRNVIRVLSEREQPLASRTVTYQVVSERGTMTGEGAFTVSREPLPCQK